MKILVLSDSHRVKHKMLEVIDNLKDKIEAIIHLGDVLDDVEYIKENFPLLKIYYVAGNCDYGAMEQSQKLIEIGGKKIFITHGHIYNVKASLTRIAYAAEEKNADICLYGHTHFPIITKYGDMFIMNPGSISAPRGIDVCSYGIIDIDENGNVTPSIVGVFDKGIYKTIDVTR